MTIRTLRTAIDGRDLSAAEAIAAAIERARAAAPLNAFLAVADELAAAHVGGGPLAGVPVAIKDSIDVAGMPCTGGTPALRTWRPRRDATVVERLRSAGAAVIGKTNLHELSVGITANNPAFGPVRNPHAPSLIAGGSSGGSAAAVAAGVVPVALGADTAGSNRIPAALCGCFGFRPTVGRYPADGVIPLSATRDTVGVFASDMDDLVLVDAVLAGTAPPAAGSRAGLHGARLGVPRPYFYEGLDAELRVVIDTALDRLADAGAVLVETEIAGLEELLATHSLALTLAEWPRDLARYGAASRCPVPVWEIVDQMAGPVERAWLENELWGDGVDHARYLDILQVGRPTALAAYRDAFARDRLDALIAPTTRLPARPIGQDTMVKIGGERVPTLAAYLRNTDPASFAGMPSISVPAGTTTSGVPAGLMLDALPGADGRLLALARAVANVVPGDARRSDVCR
ncbi:MAG: amidase family protein [Conexibacter sp.]